MSIQNSNLSLGRAHLNEEFFRRFEHEQTSSQEFLNRLSDAALSSSERTGFQAQCMSSISQLSNLLRDASSHLPAHDQRTYSTAIKTLTAKFQAACTASAPKRKFAFKKSVTQETSVEEPSSSTVAPNADASPSNQDASSETSERRLKNPSGSDFRLESHLTDNMTTLSISSLSSKIYILKDSAFRPVGQLTNLNHSYIDLSISITAVRPFSTLTIKDAVSSLLNCGQVIGPAHITKVEESTLIIWSRQVRMHDCKNCVVYLRCPSMPIIENCIGMLFAPLPDFIRPPSEEPAASFQPNLWDQVDDFKWLKAGHSPNWNVLQSEDEQAIESEGWGTIMAPEKSHLELDDLLRAGKIIK